MWRLLKDLSEEAASLLLLIRLIGLMRNVEEQRAALSLMNARS